MEFDIDISNLPTPCYLIDERLLKKNLEILKNISDKTGCKILLAQKAFSMYETYPLIGKYLAGTTASSLFEAKLGFEEMKKENHIFSPAYLDKEFEEIATICDHIVFNSPNQWEKFKNKCQNISCGLRVNPEYSEIETDLYNPCITGSRLGTTLNNISEEVLEGLEGLHFHTMCEQNSDTLKRTLTAFEEKFGKYLYKMKWINFGGGHHITRPDYDIETLINCILHIKNKYNVQVYLEPGEAVALNTGYLVSEVLEIVSNGIDVAILDTSASCHMPDVIEMPYRPEIVNGFKANEKNYTYRLSSNTCLAGDIISDYSFEKPLKVGDKLIFCDMAIYSMVKNNTFNGINLPSIAIYRENTGTTILKTFTYNDFKSRL
ncbi:MAG: carboxynorspermidine decarboxylase [Oscillospiraceae bacterium]